MKLIEYLGLSLKDDAVVDLLETHDMEVVYDFDRLHENRPDRYNTSARSAGFEMRFDANQLLKTIWCYVTPRDRFDAVDPLNIGVPIYPSIAEGRAAAEAAGWKFTQSPEEDAAADAYIRIEHANQWWHYEYRSGMLALVTLMLPWR